MSEAHDRLRRIGPFPALQIVPSLSSHELLVNPVERGTTPAPLQYHGGRTIAAPRMVNLYLNQFPDSPGDFDAISGALLADGYLDATKEFGGGRGEFLGSNRIAISLPPVVLDSQIQTYLHQLIDRGEVRASDANTMYSLIFPPGSVVQDDASGEQSCSSFCGYHSRTNRGIYYGVICDPTCQGCHGSFTPEQGRQMVYGHELGEFVTDPDGTGWYNDQTGQENADECSWIAVAWGPNNQWTVQPLVTNSAGCDTTPYHVPATPQPGPPPQAHFQLKEPFASFWAFVSSNRATVTTISSFLAKHNDWLNVMTICATDPNLQAFVAFIQDHPDQLQAAVDVWAVYLQSVGAA